MSGRDWTREPIGAARPSLKARLEAAAKVADKPAHVLDQALKDLEAAIRCFRDNER